MSDLRERMMKDFRSSGKYPNGSRGWESCLLDRISELEAIIEVAPHSVNCEYHRLPLGICDCFKSKVGEK